MLGSERRVVITGLGFVTPLGDSPDRIWGRLAAGQGALRRVEAFPVAGLPSDAVAEIRDFDFLKGYALPKYRNALRKSRKYMARDIQLAVAAAQLAVSDAGLVGGGSTPQPGEISLAHKGILFLDELPEFNRKTLEVLRQPLEEGHVTISRALRSTTFPADFILVAAMNPCPCGYRSDPRRACSCTPPQVEKYLSKISGPLLDRIDLHVEVPAVPFTQLAEAPPGPTSATFLAEVLKARARQAERFGPRGPGVNGRMTPRQVRKHCTLRPESLSLLKGAMEELGLSARAHDKVLRVARTMADLEGSDAILPQHVAEAVGYRSLDRSVWA